MIFSKYKNKKTKIFSETFDSKAELSYWQKLLILEKAGKITDLKRQVKFLLIPKIEKNRAVYYIADFVYFENDKKIVADKKGFITDVYKIKKKLMKYIHNIDILEV